MTVPAVHCEARKVSYRQTKEGLVVAFVIHPNDMPDALAVAPLGTRYMLALAAIGDDEQPIPSADKIAPSTDGSGIAAQDHLSSPPLAGRPGVETGSSPTDRARASERYHAGSPMEQARARAGILPSDLRFQQWVASQTNGVATEEHAAAFIREYCCGGGSRKSIAVEESCCWRFLAMETEYKIATQQMAEPR